MSVSDAAEGALGSPRRGILLGADRRTGMAGRRGTGSVSCSSSDGIGGASVGLEFEAVGRLGLGLDCLDELGGGVGGKRPSSSTSLPRSRSEPSDTDLTSPESEGGGRAEGLLRLGG